MSSRWLMTTGMLLALALPASGVIPVEEIGPNLLQGTITAGQTTLTAIAAAQTVANQVLDLTPLDEVAIVEALTRTLADLGAIMQQAEGLSYDVHSLQAQIAALFDLDTAPSNMSELQIRLAEIRRIRAQGYVYAMKLQTLMHTAVRTVHHLTALVHSIRNLLGAKQGMQTLVQVNMTISQTLAIQAAQQAAYERAGSVDQLEQLLIAESMARINEDIRADWPRQ